MITFSVLSDSAVKLTFDGNSHYLQDGEITVPKNSLALVKDESELITFIKAATGDAYLSFHIEDTNFANYTELENWYKANMVSAYGGGGGGGGVTPGEVQTMIDNSISGKANTSDVTSAVTEFTAALSGEITRAMASEEALSGAVSAVTDALEEVELAVAQSINVIAQSVSGKQDTLQYITEDTEEGFVDINVEYENQYYGATIGGGSVLLTSDNLNNVSDPSNRLYGTALDIYADGVGLTSTEKWYDSENGEWVEESGVHQLQSKEDGLYVDGEKIATVPMLNNKADASSVYTKTEVDTAFGMAMNSLHSLSGEVAAYSAATDAALSGKQDALVAGAGIAINGNVISATGGGGGATYSAGTNISIDTANTINCTLPITTGSNNGIVIGDNESTSNGINAVAIGHNADAGGNYSIVMGENINSSARSSIVVGYGGSRAHSEGMYNISIGDGINMSGQSLLHRSAFGTSITLLNSYETAFGLRNISSQSSSTFGDSGNTLFSIANGYSYQSTNNSHNAFEVRQNGDIYVPNTDDTTDTSSTGYSTKPMVRLQDTISATTANTSALGGLKLVKCTQAEYDALVTKDPDTLYIITNVVNNS